MVGSVAVGRGRRPRRHRLAVLTRRGNRRQHRSRPDHHRWRPVTGGPADSCRSCGAADASGPDTTQPRQLKLNGIVQRHSGLQVLGALSGVDHPRPRPWTAIRARLRAAGLVLGHVVQAIARHADVKITLKVYAHANLDAMRQALGKLTGGCRDPRCCQRCCQPGNRFGRLAEMPGGNGAPGRDRTGDISLTRRVLWPAELQGRVTRWSA